VDTLLFATAMSVARKTGSDLRIWQERLGDCYAAIAARETQNERVCLKYDALFQDLRCYTNIHGRRSQILLLPDAPRQ
jgi:hypothetical protein